MTTLILELPPHVLERLTLAAKQQRQPVEDVASSLLSESLTTGYTPADERNQIQQVFREAGLLWEPTPPLRAYMDQLESSLGSYEEQEARRRRVPP
jgi:hypothetical protein